MSLISSTPCSQTTTIPPPHRPTNSCLRLRHSPQQRHRQRRNTGMLHRRHSQHPARCDSTSVSSILYLEEFKTSPTTRISGTNYQVLDVVGEGAYGIVCSAVHRPSGRKVAIKKIAPFDHSMFCLRTLRELKLLKFLSEAGVSENIISILDIIKPRSIEEFKEVYRE